MHILGKAREQLLGIVAQGGQEPFFSIGGDLIN
jgi:hypothetical protein